MNPRASTPAEAYVKFQSALRSARRRRAYGYLRINSAQIHEQLRFVESPRQNSIRNETSHR